LKIILASIPVEMLMTPRHTRSVPHSSSFFPSSMNSCFAIISFIIFFTVLSGIEGLFLTLGNLNF